MCTWVEATIDDGTKDGIVVGDRVDCGDPTCPTSGTSS